MKYHGTEELVYQPDIRVSAFPSGLLLVQRSCVTRKSRYSLAPQVGDIMPGVESAGSIDPVYIFPAPQLIQQDAAFIKWDVSAYGRSTDIRRITKQTKLLGASSLTISSVVYSVITTVPVELQTGVITSIEDVPLSFPSALPVLSIFFPSLNKTYPFTSGWKAEQITRTNYGLWDEFSISWDVLVPENIPIPSSFFL
jgi:hypothetical protein